MKLFAIYVGGEHPAAHIEVHDIRFIVAGSIGDTHDALRAQWWGTPGTLHIDCWAEIDHVDGYDVVLRSEPSQAREKLYYVNVGGYDPAEFAEKHKNLFVVANSVREAKSRALGFVAGWKDAHRDDLYEAEHAFALDSFARDELHIHLERSSVARSLRFTCSYTPLE